jgi:hypothetical protein
MYSALETFRVKILLYNIILQHESLHIILNTASFPVRVLWYHRFLSFMSPCRVISSMSPFVSEIRSCMCPSICISKPSCMGYLKIFVSFRPACRRNFAETKHFLVNKQKFQQNFISWPNKNLFWGSLNKNEAVFETTQMCKSERQEELIYEKVEAKKSHDIVRTIFVVPVLNLIWNEK